MIFVGKVVFFFVGKVLEIYYPKRFAYQDILVICTLCLKLLRGGEDFANLFGTGPSQLIVVQTLI